jgi:ABC-type uncharacterized transport system auxiliary subunit
MRWSLPTAAASVALAACVTVGVGTGDAPAVTYFSLDDLRAPAAAATAGIVPSLRLAIHASGADPLADSTAIVYSRRPGERATYQLAAWSEKPSRRLAQLVQRRLEAGGRFAAVTLLGQPVDTDVLLVLAVESVVHDVSGTPGRAQLALRAELIDRRRRARLAHRHFSASAAVAEANAPAAAAAFAAAAADLLDELAAWVAATTARPRG